MSKVTKKDIDEQLAVYFPDGYYDFLRKKTLERLWKHFTFKHKHYDTRKTNRKSKNRR